MEGSKQFEYGYYRFADHPYIRKIKSGLRSYFNFRQCILFTSYHTGLYELVREITFENGDEPSRLIILDLDDNSVAVVQHLASVEILIYNSISNIATLSKLGHQDLFIYQK